MADGRPDPIWAITSRCVACGSCEDACERRHGVARLSRPTHGLPIAFPELCQHCLSPACVDACIAGALASDAESGQVLLDADRCVGCWSCIMACPYAAVRRDLRDRPLSVRCDRCDGFRRSACVAACPTLSLQRGPEATLAKAMKRPEGMGRRLAAALVCIALPLTGLLAGPWLKRYRHGLGIAAGVLIAVAFLLPMLRWFFSSIVRDGVWVRLHVWGGVAAATAGSAHAAGRFAFTLQTFALLSLFALAVTGVAYAYVRPLLLMLESASLRRASAPGGHPRLLALDAAARQGAARVRWVRALLRFVDGCHPLHVLWAVLATGLVAAHVLVMTVIGGG
ncbi:4Fe-4S dicluster domain-containing protein [bacterium]|nr:4Fe-4S dicluster domain-containing protein [bacterium]